MTRQSLPTESTRRAGGFRRFILAHSRGHLRHSSPDDSNFNSITRTRRKLCLFLRLRQSASFSPRNPSCSIPTYLCCVPTNLNLIMTLHVAVLALTPSSVAYLPLASSALSKKSRSLALLFSLGVGTGSRKILEILKGIKYYHWFSIFPSVLSNLSPITYYRASFYQSSK